MDLETAGVVAVTLAAFKLAETMLHRLTRNGKSSLTEQEHGWIRMLHDMHNQYDENGAPKWYVPRSLGATQEKILELIRDIVRDQRHIADVLERIERNRENRP